MLLPISFTPNPSTVVKNDVAFAVAVPDVVSTKSIVFVVATVLMMFAGATKLPLASTGISYFNPILLYGLLVLYLSLVIFSLAPPLILPSSKSFQSFLLPLV